ncbi:MAG TPA: ribosomal protein S18-alanine N-acetyltransferase [Candidatus Acidoferrum sp.]
MNKRQEALVIRPFDERDAVAASEILREAPQAAGWSALMIRDLLATTGVSGFLAERQGRATGFILGREVLDEGEILNLAVVRANRRRGEGTALSRQLMNSFAARGVQRVFLEVRASNLGAIAFYTKLGFQQVGRREGYYQAPAEAALILEHSTKNPQLGTE